MDKAYTNCCEGHSWKVCYSVRRDGSVREMPPARNIATLALAESHAEILTGLGYERVRVSADICG